MLKIKSEDFLQGLEHPQINSIIIIRDLILLFDVIENIKWNALNYTFNNKDRITFNFTGKGFFRLIFHIGAKVKTIDIQNEFELLKNSETLSKNQKESIDLLIWLAKDRAMIKFDNKFDFNLKNETIKTIISLWLEKTKKY
jgi:hypothetical protein